MSGIAIITDEMRSIALLSTLLHRPITLDPKPRAKEDLSITPLEIITQAGHTMVKSVGDQGPQINIGKLAAASLQKAFHEIETAQKEGVPLESVEMNKRLEKYINSPDMHLLKILVPKQGNFSTETDEKLRGENHVGKPSPEQQREIIKEYLKIYSPNKTDGTPRTDAEITEALAKQPDASIESSLYQKIAPGLFGDEKSYHLSIRMAREHNGTTCSHPACDLRYMEQEAKSQKPTQVINNFSQSNLSNIAPTR